MGHPLDGVDHVGRGLTGLMRRVHASAVRKLAKRIRDRARRFVAELVARDAAIPGGLGRLIQLGSREQLASKSAFAARIVASDPKGSARGSSRGGLAGLNHLFEPYLFEQQIGDQSP